ncbi:hypothetical protein C8J56DRAFT_730405, partial [Mycena floridula]
YSCCYREILFPECPLEELAAHVYLRSVHNISIERSWLRLRLDFGDICPLFRSMSATSDISDSELCRWLWSRLLNQELQAFIAFRNGARMRRDNDKDGPSAMSRNEAFSDLRSWGGKNYLICIPDLSIIRELKEAMGGDELLAFTSAEFSARAQTAYDELNIQKLSMENVW